MERIACKFAVIQFTPDVIRQEKINVGVIMHDLQSNIIHYRFLDYLQKFNKLLTQSQLDEFRRFRQIFKRHIKSLDGVLFDHKLKDLPINEDYLDNLQEIDLNKFSIINVRPIMTENPVQKMNDLFNIYVYPEDKVEGREKPFVNEIWSRFKKSGVHVYIKKDIEIPAFPFPIEFGYVNGCVNLIQPIRFIDNSKENFKEGLMWRDALQLKQKADEFKDSPFYAIVKPPSNPQKFGFDLALEQFRRFDNVTIINYETNEFERLLEQIRTHGHIIQ